jgi:hypothetical protein
MDKVNAIQSHKQYRVFPEANNLCLDFLAMASRSNGAYLTDTDFWSFGFDNKSSDSTDSADLIKSPPSLDTFFHEGKPFIKRLNHPL